MKKLYSRKYNLCIHKKTVIYVHNEDEILEQAVYSISIEMYKQEAEAHP
jgi:hypothetical protein